jgi:signal transduction histidine kinase
VRPLVWVVDDSATDAARAAQALSPTCDVRVFADGSIALEQLATSSPPEAMVLDWVMPGVSGIEVVHFMRSSGGPLSRVPVLLLTVRHEPEQIAEGLAAGANDFLSKPYHEQELHSRVAALVRTAQLVERVHRAEENVRTLLLHAPDALVVIEAQAQITFANEAAGQLFHRAPEALIGESLDVLLPELPIRNISIGPGADLLPLPDVTYEGRILSPAVRVLPSDTSGSTTIALRDVTDRRHAEARRLDFYSVMAHDLRSPLNAMLMRTDLLLRNRRGPLPPEAVADLQKFQASIRAMVKMIKDFLDLASMEGAGYKIDREDVDVSSLVAKILDDLRPLSEANGIALAWQHEGADAVVPGDPHRLSQVLSNLVGNAIKFTPAGGRIDVRVRATDRNVVVTVEDTGAGIAPEHLESIFERFIRAPTATTTRRAGWGLGLMIVREIVEAHGGRVGVRSQLGKGSQFWFRLPRLEQRPKAAAP